MTEWIVDLEIAHELDQERAARIVEDVLEHLAPYSPVGAVDPQSLSVQMSVEAETIEKAVAVARRLFTSALRKSGFVGPVVIVMAGAQTEDKLIKSLRESNVPDIVGVAEVANILSVSRQRVSELARSGRFPHPVTTLAAGPIWYRAAIARYVERWPRRPGRPKKNATKRLREASRGLRLASDH